MQFSPSPSVSSQRTIASTAYPICCAPGFSSMEIKFLRESIPLPGDRPQNDPASVHETPEFSVCRLPEHSDSADGNNSRSAGSRDQPPRLASRSGPICKRGLASELPTKVPLYKDEADVNIAHQRLRSRLLFQHTSQLHDLKCVAQRSDHAQRKYRKG